MPVFNDDIRQLIKDAVDVELLLKNLGFRVSRSTGSEVRAPCIIHGGDNPTGFSIRTDTKTWKCFTHQCEQDNLGGSQNDLFALVMKVKNVPFLESVKYLANFSGLNLDLENMMVEQTSEFRRRRDTNNYVRSMNKIASRHKQLDTLSEEIVLGYASQCDDYFLQFGFRVETLDTFEIGAMFDEEGVLRATVPIRDSAGRLVGISARREDGDDEPRYLLTPGFQKGNVLYNLHRAREQQLDTVVIVEGFKAAWAVHEAGIKNVVACMGSIITEEQVFQLCRTRFKNCLVMLDGDKAGRKGTPKTVKKLSKAFNVLPVVLPDGVCPDDLDRQELKELVELYLFSF